MPDGFDAWIKEHGIEEEVRPILYTVVTWVKWCSAPSATEEQRFLACADLAISFFYPDDYQEDDYEDLFREYEANLDGQERPTERATVLAHRDLLQRLQALGRPMDAFVESRRRLLSEYRLRNAVMRGRASTSFARYSACRLVTIYVYQWVDLWLVLQDFGLTKAEFSREDVQDAIRLATTYYYLGNDLYSFARDAEKGEPNLVCILSDEESITMNEAAEKIAIAKEAANRDFEAAATRVEGRSPGAKRIAELLRKLVAVANAARSDNPERYVPPDELVGSTKGLGKRTARSSGSA